MTVSFRSCVLALALLPLMVSASFAQSAWQKSRWHDEPVWVSRQGGLQALVSEARSRLIFFGPAEPEQNLLSAPRPLPAPTDRDISPNWGGHRFWLGPQSRWKWPPLKEWEFSAAAVVRAEGPVLTVRHARLDPAYPALERAYSWEGDRLRCTVRWSGGTQPFYGMQVFAVDAPAELEARLYRWEHVPDGVVAINGDHPRVEGVLPNPAVTIDGDRAVIRDGEAVAKLGFYPQAVSVRRGDWELRLLPGPSGGVPLESPDFGYLSQVWVGRSGENFCELEQITPYLLPGPDGACTSTVYLEARRR